MSELYECLLRGFRARSTDPRVARGVHSVPEQREALSRFLTVSPLENLVNCVNIARRCVTVYCVRPPCLCCEQRFPAEGRVAMSSGRLVSCTRVNNGS